MHETLTDYHAHASADDCLTVENIDPVKESMLVYYGLPLTKNNACRFVFTTDEAFADNLYDESSVLGRYSRPRDRERFVLFETGKE